MTVRGVIRSLPRSLCWTVLAVYFMFFMDWLFFMTQPQTFWKVQPLGDKAGQLLVSPLAVTAIAVPVWLACALAGTVFRAKGLRWLAPAAVFTAAVLLMSENFTGTLFNWSVMVTAGPTRIACLVTVASAFVAIWIFFLRRVDPTYHDVHRRAPGMAAILVALSLAMTAAGAVFNRNGETAGVRKVSVLAAMPDIFLLSSDGMEVDRMSLYGYSRPTTPFLESFREQAVIFPNVFANGDKTAASLPSVLTGRHPLSSRKVVHTNVFSGVDSYRHLPGILKNHGYRTVQIGNGDNVDAFKWNMRDAFDQRNRTHAGVKIFWRVPSGLLSRSGMELYFSQYVLDRAAERLLHVLFVKDSEGNINAPTFYDEAMVEFFLELIRKPSPPLFVQMHLERTHAVHVAPNDASVADDGKMYEEGILAVDGIFRILIQGLRDSGRFENAVIVIYTDHGYKYRLNHRLPLLMRFPGERQAVMTEANVQMLDIAPTLLDYLGIPAPEWMEGSSLFRPLESDRVVIGLTGGYGLPGLPLIGSSARLHEPHLLHAVQRQRFFTLDLYKKTLVREDVAGHTAPADGGLLEDGEMRALMEKFVRDRGIDFSAGN